ncbi:AraC family transcriptional regulator [Paenibacillus sp. CF384]|uniref:AraC family transcriptional regulator n=1 Tax=Paenibacillus sp. CF384 TaxID=1884382 RepID=UPI00089B8E74|nr:AraC family transcriptional regulator [Paenibacillus sp. CF384]SDW15622.1 AraC-type DNA-binding protein [Paenibacillus sp. CF384]
MIRIQASQYVFNHHAPPIHLHFYGQSDCLPGHSYGPAIRDHYLYVFVKQGKGIYRSNDTTYELQANDSFLLFPQQLGFYQADQHDPWSYMWIGFNIGKRDSFVQFAGITPESPVISHESPAAITSLFQQLFDVQGSPAYTEFLVTGLIYQLFAAVMQDTAYREPISRSTSTADVYITKAIQFITDNYAEPLSVPIIAAQLGLERSYFTKMFKDHAGVPPHAFLIQVRMNKAAELLDKTNLSIEHIAYSIGFNNINYFSSAFTRLFKLNPSAYRKLRKQHDIIRE